MERSCQFHHDYTRVAPTDYTITRLHSKSSTDGLHGYTTTLRITLRITLEQLGDYSDYTVMVVTLRITLRVAPTDYTDYTALPTRITLRVARSDYTEGGARILVSSSNSHRQREW